MDFTRSWRGLSHWKYTITFLSAWMSSRSPSRLLPLWIWQGRRREIILSSETRLEDNSAVLVTDAAPVCGGLQSLFSDSAGVLPQSGCSLGLSRAGEFSNTVNGTSLLPFPSVLPQNLNSHPVHQWSATGGAVGQNWPNNIWLARWIWKCRLKGF